MAAPTTAIGQAGRFGASFSTGGAKNRSRLYETYGVR